MLDALPGRMNLASQWVAANTPSIATNKNTMKPITILGLLAVSFCLITPVEAKGGNNNKEAQKRKQEREQKRQERAAKRDAIDEFLKPRDLNKDGSLTLDEFLSGETDKEEGARKFEEANKNGDRYLTKKEIEEMLGV